MRSFQLKWPHLYKSRLHDLQLSSLSLLRLHLDIHINRATAIDELARRHPSQLQLVNVLVDDKDKDEGDWW